MDFSLMINNDRIITLHKNFICVIIHHGWKAGKITLWRKEGNGKWKRNWLITFMSNLSWEYLHIKLLKDTHREKSDSLTHSRRTFPRRTLSRRTLPRPDTSPMDTSPTGHIPDRHFPNQTHPRWTLPRPNTSPTNTSPTDTFPTRNFIDGHFPDWTLQCYKDECQIEYNKNTLFHFLYSFSFTQRT